MIGVIILGVILSVGFHIAGKKEPIIRLLGSGFIGITIFEGLRALPRSMGLIDTMADEIIGILAALAITGLFMWFYLWKYCKMPNKKAETEGIADNTVNK